MKREPQRRKPDSERKTKPLTVWLTGDQEELLNRAAGDIPVSTWARAELLARARTILGVADAPAVSRGKTGR